MGRRGLASFLTLTVGAAAFGGAIARAQTVQDLQQLSISELANIDISSVTKTRQPLSTAPAAIYVITHDQILRSGAMTIPEILRLAPNLQVIQTSASQYIITARGFSGNSADQAFANKLLVLIDGRSVYTPMFSGVYWDMQDVVPADIERIEVISGPGATLWGANAVNGVINIITRKAQDTQGGLIDISAGNLEQTLTARYGGEFSDNLAYRIYLRDYLGDDTETASGGHVSDHWSQPQGGFRLDWTPAASDNVTFEGDDLAANEAQNGAPNEDIFGTDLLGRWTHEFENGSTLDVQGYFNREERDTQGNGGEFWDDTYDLEAQHNFSLNDWNQIAWGAGVREVRYDIMGTSALFFVPSSGTLSLADGFVQDSITLAPSVTAVAGFKLESDPWSGIAPLPSVRVSWKADDSALLWAAVSRAIRSPTPFDTDVEEKSGSTLLLAGNPDFESEKLWAYEIGGRFEPTDRLSFSVSGYYNTYDDLRNVVITIPTLFPLTWGNGLEGHTYGFEAWGEYQLLDWWRVSASWNELQEKFNFRPGYVTLLGFSQVGDDPHDSATLRSAMNLGSSVTFDADFRYVGALPNPAVPSYFELNSDVGWQMTDDLRISVAGFNLLHPRHLEFPGSEANAIPRSFAVDLQWRFK